MLPRKNSCSFTTCRVITHHSFENSCFLRQTRALLGIYILCTPAIDAFGRLKYCRRRDGARCRIVSKLFLFHRLRTRDQMPSTFCALGRPRQKGTKRMPIKTSLNVGWRTFPVNATITQRELPRCCTWSTSFVAAISLISSSSGMPASTSLATPTLVWVWGPRGMYGRTCMPQMLVA